ncbi:hypothetical protein OSB04_024748 [Centaurea solstitialis]|uniref:DUF4218 domain-containing protein n=1 Tax=Centaurea solstitialis TaxID=347529 RepID=A0AA38T046_9ASTR|nr:hypothetical protein OSB04_024748 [Centaurea solstitialis]
MQRLLPIGVKAYLDPAISTPIIELCFFFKQICARNLMMSDMKKAEKQLINILCNFEQIFPPAFFDIMIHFVMHLPEEAIQGGPVYMRWMYPFERYMKKLENYVRNKARPEGSIAEGFVADEALTFCSWYLDGVPTRFNRPDRNEDAPIPTRELYVFQSVCTPISKRCRYKAGLHTSEDSGLNIYSEFAVEMPHESNLQTNFPRWFKNKINCVRAANDSQCSNELFALANGPSNASTYTACIVNGVRTDTQQRCVTKNNITSISTEIEWFVEDQYILATQAKQVFYLDDPSKSRQRGESSQNYRKVVQEVNHRKIWERDIVVEDDEDDVVHDSSSYDLSLCAELDHLTYTSLSIGQSIEVEDVPPPKDKEEDFIHDSEEDIDDNDDEDSYYEQNANNIIMAAVARGHGGDTGGDPPPSGNWLPPSGNCGGGGSKKGRGPARNVEMRAMWKKNGNRALPIEFDGEDLDSTWMLIGLNSAYYKSFIGNLMKELPLYYPRWDKVPTELKMPIMPKIQTYFDMEPHLRGPYSANIGLVVQRLCAESYKGAKNRFKEKWFDERGGSWNLNNYVKVLHPT